LKKASNAIIMYSMSKKVLIIGIAGQDGSYLAELLLSKGYEVHGLERESGDEKKYWRIRHILDKLIVHTGDVSDYKTVKELVIKIKPSEIYHLATKHDLPNSLENYLSIKAINLDSTYFLLSAIKEFSPDSKFFFASSSKVFGNPSISPQNEETAFKPNSLYGISKVAASALVKMYREKEGTFACSGILYTHESPRRDPDFLSRKVTLGATQIKSGTKDELKVGDLNAKRDWGYAGDYVEAMWLMLQQDKPEDFVIGSGEIHTVQELIEVAFGVLDLDWRKYVTVDPEFVRPPEDVEQRADISKAKKVLDWSPKVGFKELVQMMVKKDYQDTQ